MESKANEKGEFRIYFGRRNLQKKNLNISFLYLRSVIIKRFNVVVLFVCFLPDSASTGVRDWLELVSAKSPDRTVKLGSAGRADWAAFEKNK